MESNFSITRNCQLLLTLMTPVFCSVIIYHPQLEKHTPSLQKYNAKKYKNMNADVLIKTDHPLHSTRVSAPSSKLFPPSRQIAREGR